MKKFLIFLIILIFSCEKKSVPEQKADIEIDQNSPTIPVENSMHKDSAYTRQIIGDTIFLRTQNDRFPLTINEEFTKDNQGLILKIDEVARENISFNLIPEDSTQNIRLNHIKLPSGKMDGPFGRSLFKYEIPDIGDVYLIVGRSNMASGETKGKFTIKIY